MHELPKNTNSNLYFIYAQFSAEDLIKHFFKASYIARNTCGNISSQAY